MKKTLNGLAVQALDQAKGVVSSLDGRFAMINAKPEILSESLSPGEMILRAVSTADSLTSPQIFRSISRLKRDHRENMAKARDPLKRARQLLNQLSEILDLLENGSTPDRDPDDPLLKSAVQSLRAAHLSGAYDSAPLVAKLKRLISEGRENLATREAQFEKIRSAGDVAVANLAAQAYSRLSQDPGLTEATQKRFGRAAAAYRKAKLERQQQHRILTQGRA